jgi:hypothetical protein
MNRLRWIMLGLVLALMPAAAYADAYWERLH